MEIVECLAADQRLNLLVVEPHIQELPGILSNLENVDFVDVDTALKEADVVALLVNHREFQALDRGLLAGKTIVDTSGSWRTL